MAKGPLMATDRTRKRRSRAFQQRRTVRLSPVPGLKVVFEQNPSSLSSAIGLFVGCGSRRESPAQHGLTHLCEHLFFKGTSRHTAEQISTQIERHGGDINAFTDRELTAFHTWIPVDQTEMALELIFEMLYDSLFDPHEFERERAVVVQELRSYADSSEEEFSDSFLEVAFPHHSLSRRIGGFERGVKKLSIGKTLEYITESFLRSPRVLSIVSPLPEAEMRAIIRRTLKKADKWRWGHLIGKKPKRFLQEAPRYPKNFSTRSQMRSFDADQVQMGFMFPGVSLTSRQEVLWTALANLLGGGSSSMLYREVREKRGLAYSVQAVLYSYSDVGILQGYLATEPKKLLEAVSVVGETCRRLAAGVTQDELEFVKSMMEGTTYMSYDGIHHRMESLAREELLLGRPYSLRDAVRDVRAITKRDFDRASQVLLSTPCFFGLGPVTPRDLNRVMKAWKGNSRS